MIYGIGTHIVSTNKVRCVTATKAIGATSLREDISWNGAETTIGNFSLTVHHRAKIAAMEEIGTENILILAYGNTAHGIGQPYTQAERDKFLDYVRWIVPLTKHCVRYYEVWNEWNHGSGATAAQITAGTHSGTQQYADLCKDCYPVIKSLAPNSLVLTGSTSKVWTGHWYPALCDAGILPVTDGFSLHPYTHSEGAPNYLPPRAMIYIDDIDARVKAKNGGVSVPQYITEMGWPTHTNGHAAAAVAGYLSRFYKLAEERSFIKGVWWYDIFDSGNDAANMQQRFGLLADDAVTPKPAYHAYRALVRRDEREEWGWVEIGVTAAVETLINNRNPSVPDHVMRGLVNLRSAGSTKAVRGAPMRLLRGPVLLSALHAITDRFGASLEVLQGPIVKGVTPAQTTVTRDSTWPNGWT